MANADRRQARFPDDDHNKDIGRPVEREQGADEDGKGKAATTSGDDDKPVEGEQGADDDDNKAVRALDHKGCKRINTYMDQCIHIYIYTSKYIYIYIYMYRHTYIYIYMYIYNQYVICTIHI